MKRASAIVLGTLSTIILAGCPSPTVKYVMDPEKDFTGEIKFRLVSSNILIAKAQEDPKTGATKVDASNNTTQSFSDVSATVVPKEDERSLYAILPKSTWLWLVNTNISATFQDNTRLIKQLGVTVDDNRIKAIQAVGAIATAVAGFAAPPKPPTIKVPVVIDPFESSDDWRSLPSDAHWEYRVTFDSPKTEQHDLDAVATGAFFAKYKDDGWFNSTSVIPVSSCRTITLKIRPTSTYMAELDNPKGEKETASVYEKRIEPIAQRNLEEAVESLLPVLKKTNQKGKDENEDTYNNRLRQIALNKYEPEITRTFPLQIADPRFVRTIRLPDKGSISTHSVCGADTKTETTQITGYQDLLGELGKQAKAVYDAQKAKAKNKVN